MSPTTIALFVPKTRCVELTEDTYDETAHDAERIRQALDEQRIYRQAGLSVAALAVHLSLPEYRLRSLIHNQLGYRNFNALLHHYRVKDVVQALADEPQGKTPILTLALSCGYQSINPFNRAFRDIMDMTPTEFRRRAKKEQHELLKNTPNFESDHSA